jgi:outer membrane receptor protein involved in Fe transport
MHVSRFSLALVLCGVIVGIVRAQERAKEPPLPGKEPTLPEVVVQPEQQPTPSDYAPPSQTWGGESYPGLTQQMFGSGDGTPLNSATRSEQSLFDLPSLGTIIDRGEIVERQSQDMFQALQTEVGVLMQQTGHGQASPFLRGLTGQQVLILIDGIRLNNATFRAGPNQYFNLIDPGQVERIEIVRGPESVLWGSDAVGGVINVVTRSASSDRGDYARKSFTEYVGTADTSSYSRGNIEGWVGRVGAFGGASYLNVNDLERGGALGRQPFTDYSQYAGDLKFDYLLGSCSLLTVGLQHFEQEDLPRSDRFPPFVFGPPASAPRPTWFDPQQRDLAYVRVQGLACRALFDAYSTTFSYSRNKEATREIRSATREDFSEFDDDTSNFSLVLARDLDWLGRLTYGFDWYYDDVDAWRNRVNPQTGSVTPQNPQFPNDSTYEHSGVFLSWDVDLTQEWMATAGVRYENADAAGTLNAVQGTPHHFTRTYQDWIAGAGLTYKVDSMWNVFCNVSEGYRAPNLDDLAADNPVLQSATDLPSLEVQPEHAWTYEIGLKLNAPRLRLQVAQYWTDLQDFIQRQAVDINGNPVPYVIGPYGTLIPGSNNFIRANFDSHVDGTELTGEYLLPNNWCLYGNAWYTYGQDLVHDQPLSRIPPVQGILGLRWREGNRRWFDVYTWMVARQNRYNPLDNIDARFPLGGTPGYATFNVRMGTTLGRRGQHRLSLGLENLTDKTYRVLGSGVDGPGFNVVFGYELLQ